ncbi:MAG: C2H2-type zinc finger protein [Halobaculum sp.]|jgi:hypothetical protein
MTFECSQCGAEFERYSELSAHGVCDDAPAAARSDGCPLCGEQYDSYLDHIHNEH